MDKYPYITEKNLHKHYKAFDFCSFFHPGAANIFA